MRWEYECLAISADRGPFGAALLGAELELGPICGQAVHHDIAGWLAGL
jgi:hypothetical protein